MMKGLLILVSFYVLVSVNINGQSSNFKVDYKFSDVVFIGKVTYKNANSNVHSFNYEGIHFNIEVLEYFKGKEYNVNTWSYFCYPRSWDYSFDLGKEYLICARIGAVNSFLDLESELTIKEKDKAAELIAEAREYSKIPDFNKAACNQKDYKLIHNSELRNVKIVSFLIGMILMAILWFVTRKIKSTKPNKPL